MINLGSSSLLSILLWLVSIFWWRTKHIWLLCFIPTNHIQSIMLCSWWLTHISWHRSITLWSLATLPSLVQCPWSMSNISLWPSKEKSMQIIKKTASSQKTMNIFILFNKQQLSTYIKVKGSQLPSVLQSTQWEEVSLKAMCLWRWFLFSSARSGR